MEENITKSGVDLNVCSYCKTSIDNFSRTVDHLFPKGRGGILSNKNKVPSCSRCNQIKGSLDIKEFEMALEAMMNFEHSEHKKRIGLLKKIKGNVKRIVEGL